MSVPKNPAVSRTSWLRAAVWLLGGLVLLLGLAWFGIPPLARWQIETRGSAALGRAVTVAAVRFVPWRLQTTLEGLEVAGPPGAAAPLLRVERVGFRTAFSSLWQGAPVIEALDIDSPHLRLARLGEGRYDIDDLIERLSTPADPARPPARYVLRNLQLSGGAIDFDDRAVSGTVKHTVRDLRLALPAISSLRADRDGEVAPTLAFTLDGSRFDSRAEALPFAELRKGQATLQFDGLDLVRLRDYWPASLPLRPRAGTLDARLTLSFAQNAQPADTLLDISGSLNVKGLALRGPDGRDAVAADAIALRIASLAPLQRRVRLERLEITRPRLDIARDAAGRIDLLPPAASGKAGGATPVAAPWKVELAQFVVRQGSVGWRDAGVAARLGLEAVELDASAIAWPMTAPASITGSAALAGAAGARLRWTGSVGPDSGRLVLVAQAVPLALAQPYLKARLGPAVRGVLGGEGTVAWSPAGIVTEGLNMAVDDLALAQGNTVLAGAKRLALRDLRLDSARRSVSAAGLDLVAPTGQVSRDARGAFMFADWMPAAAPGARAPAATTGGAAPWKIALKSLNVERGRVGWRDAVPRRPVAIDLSDLSLRTADLAWPMPATGPGAAIALQLGATVAAGQATPGTLRFRGTVQPRPLLLDGRLDAARLPLQAVEPYFGDALNVQIVRADLGFAGALRLALKPAGMELRAEGNASVDNGRVDSATPNAPSQAVAASAAASAGSATRAVRSSGVLTPGARRATTLFSWRTLQLRNATLKIVPGQPLFWGVYETKLGDFFARLAINEDGRLNLRELTRAAPAGGSGGTPAAAPASVPARKSEPPELHFGEIHLANGRVQFTDNFIKPAYSASLSELEGVLGAFDSVGAVYAAPAMATLALRGKAEGSAALDIRGKLNPLATPLAIDIVAKVDDLDLPALSPYAVKYMGHGIQRGKLSVDVHYRIQPDGKLEATNSLVLRQLVFDEQADGASGSLPVRLAAALLADSNGVIDLNLPISGSLNDPQFSLAPVIGKALVNLFVRAVTSPLSLISKVFSGGSGGGAENASVAFAPGSAELSATARQGLDSVAQALAGKPSLQLTVSGAASTEADAEGYRRERLRQLARQEKRRALLAAAPTVAAPPAAQITLTDAEYPALLKRVYAATDMPKPRNLVGMQKDLPVDEMERLLAAQVDVTDASARGLALQRATSVRDYLAAHGVPAARIFLGAVRMEEGAAPGWTPAAQLRITAN